MPTISPGYASSTMLFLGHEGCRCREAHHLVVADVAEIDVPLEFAGAYFHECDAGAVVGVHVGVDLEHEAGESILLRRDSALHCLYRTGRGCDLYEAVEQFFDTECIECRSEEYRSHFSAEIVGGVKFRIYALNELQVITQLGRVLLAHKTVDLRRIYIRISTPFTHGLL